MKKWQGTLTCPPFCNLLILRVYRILQIHDLGLLQFIIAQSPFGVKTTSFISQWSFRPCLSMWDSQNHLGKLVNKLMYLLFIPGTLSTLLALARILEKWCLTVRAFVRRQKVSFDICSYWIVQYLFKINKQIICCSCFLFWVHILCQ